MASLDKIAESLNVKLNKHEKGHDKNDIERKSSFKRRTWFTNQLEDTEENNEVYRPHTIKGSIDPIDKRDLSTPLINPVYRPHLYKGVYKPLNISLNDLRSNPLKIAQYIFELLVNKTEKITDKLRMSQIMKNLEISKDSSRTGLRFLMKNNLVERVEFKVGKLGWSKYKLKETLFNELNYAYQKGLIAPLKVLENYSEQKGSNSSSNNYINNTTVRPLLDWSEIDVSPLTKIGFNAKHLLQLKTKNLPDTVQESINHFSYSLQFNAKTKKYDDPLSVLIGVLRKGEVWIEPNYKSPQEISLEKLVEEKKNQQTRIETLEEELIKNEFEIWCSTLSETEKEELTKSVSVSFLSKSFQERVKKSCLLEYFKKDVFHKK